jgi:hypothetical protein
VGSFSIDEATPLEAVTVDSLLAPSAALRDYPAVTVGADIEAAIGHGKVLGTADLGVALDDEGPWAVVAERGDLLAVYTSHPGGRVKPAVVLSP